jgi:hypothetical protein
VGAAVDFAGLRRPQARPSRRRHSDGRWRPRRHARRIADDSISPAGRASELRLEAKPAPARRAAGARSWANAQVGSPAPAARSAPLLARGRGALRIRRRCHPGLAHRFPFRGTGRCNLRSFQVTDSSSGRLDALSRGFPVSTKREEPWGLADSLQSRHPQASSDPPDPVGGWLEWLLQPANCCPR